jgi:hypothetical protein
MGFRFSSRFGSTTFLNFDQNYQRARDDFVYVHSQNGPSAYACDDVVVLARVSRSLVQLQIVRGFGRFWATAIEACAGLLLPGTVRARGCCARSCNRSLSDGVGIQQRRGLGFIDAPEPWGRWTTVFFTAAWDLWRHPTAIDCQASGSMETVKIYTF